MSNKKVKYKGQSRMLLEAQAKATYKYVEDILHTLNIVIKAYRVVA
jgi:hypothetical protein